MKTVKDLRQLKNPDRLLKRVDFTEYPGLTEPNYLALYRRNNALVVEWLVTTSTRHAIEMPVGSWLQLPVHIAQSAAYKAAHAVIWQEAQFYSSSSKE